jgi:hypothetical protein
MPELKEARKRSERIDGYDYELVEAYKDKFGNVWWSFVDPLRMPGSRALAGEIAATWADLNMTKEDIKNYFVEMRKAGNSGDIVRMFRLFDTMEARLDWACEDKSLLNLAAVYFLVNDESPGAPTPHYTTLKHEVFDKDHDARAFFLGRAFALIKVSSEFSGSDILNYLEIRRAMEARGDSTPSTSSPATSSSSASTTSTSRSGSLPVRPSARRKSS